MSYIALIKLARLFDSQPLQPADWFPAEKTLFQRGALYVLPTAKLLVNHDRDREIGHVLEVTEFPDTDGNWLAARCQVDAPPAWLEQGKTKASFSYATTQSQQIGDWTRILRGVLTEVSLLAPSVAPAESRAKVVLLREPTASPCRRRFRKPPIAPPSARAWSSAAGRRSCATASAVLGVR